MLFPPCRRPNMLLRTILRIVPRKTLRPAVWLFLFAGVLRLFVLLYGSPLSVQSVRVKDEEEPATNTGHLFSGERIRSFKLPRRFDKGLPIGTGPSFLFPKWCHPCVPNGVSLQLLILCHLRSRLLPSSRIGA